MVAAAEIGMLERVQELVEQGVDKDKGLGDGRTALTNASWKGHLDIVQYLVEQGADKDKPANYGNTPLIIATIWGHVDIVRYLLEQGVNRDRATNDGRTPLHFAANEGHLEIAMLLMSYGADLNAKTKDSLLPIDFAATEEMIQAISDEPRRRMDHGHKRATEQDRHPNAVAAASISTQQVGQQNDKKPDLAQETIIEEEAKFLAEINEDSEPSSDEEDDD